MKKLLLRTLLLATMMGLNITWSAFANTDKYRLTLRDDPATTITIAWNQISGSDPIVYFDTNDHGTDYSAYTMNKTVDRSIEYKGMSNQFARLTGLQPNTAYYFVIKDSEGTSERYWFKTAPSSSSERLSFIAGGDSRNNREPRQNGNRIVARLRPHAVFFGGDMTSAGTDEQWQDWFDDWQLTIGNDGRIVPIVAARGNHESSNSMVYDLFDTPSTDIYYGLTFGTDLLRVYTLNTEMSITGDQTTWLANDLAANSNVTWKSAQYHKPMRPHVSGKTEGNTHYSSWANIFYQNNVKLVVECDAHTVKTTWPVKPTTESGNEEGFVRDDVSGTVYTGEGCWGAPLRSNNDNKSWTRDSGMFNQVKWIFVDQSKIEIRTIKVDNATSVETVNDSNIFSAPANLDIWSPSNGPVVTITNTVGLPDINLISPEDQGYYSTPTTLTLAASAMDTDGSVAKVEFYINDNSIGLDTSSPYEIDYLIPADGNYSFYAIVEDNDGNTIKSETRSFKVGIVDNILNVRVIADEDDAEEAEDGMVDISSSDLELVYDPHESAGNQKVGLRFKNLDIPQGATITEAYIQFTADEDKNETGSLSIYGQFANMPAPFTTTLNDISSRPKTTASVVWSPENWLTVGEAGSAQRTPDLQNIAQEIVNRPGWNAGHMVFIFEGNGRRVAESYKGSSTAAPQLVISYKEKYTLSVNATNGSVTTSPEQDTFDQGSEVILTAVPNSDYEFSGWSDDALGTQNPLTITMDSNKNITANFTEIPTGTTITIGVFKGNDDAQEAANGVIDISSTSLDLGDQIVGVRFRDIDIPQGATINDAYIQFTTDEVINAEGTLSIQAQFANKPSVFTTALNDISSRPKTTASVNWTPEDWTVAEEASTAQRTPNLKSIVQEIVNRSAWNLGHMAFIFQGNGHRVAKSYNGSSTSAPQLIVTYDSNTNSRVSLTESPTVSNNMSVYPNPIGEIVNFEFDTVIPELITITFYDISGRVALVNNISSKLGHNKIVIETATLKSGNYTVHIVGDGISEAVKLIK
ncbi:InlB B-repeat-containing protein [Flammeovirga kamogawensis]|nr:Ig-like domain-containing protein [Flammeovirga kamogawensis]